MPIRNRKHKNRSKSNGNNWDKKTGGERYNEIVRENEKYVQFYKEQGLIAEAEWDEFNRVIRTDLPVSFRVQGCHKDREQLISEMKSKFFEPIAANEEAKEMEPRELAWYPGAYQTPMSRSAVRSHPVLAQLHNFLVTEAELGFISRQEAVSMIPPLLLAPQAEHMVLDMCAAPGSKTMQLIEMQHETNDNPSGMVVANDVDKSRCYLLIHQILKRMKSANAVITCEDGTVFPNVMKSETEVMKFDRVLCDVICSGDGTIRKNADIWKKWTPQDALGLHRLQLSIARRGLQQLKEGGLMVYSTCSMNPMEDEAVVAQLLRESKGAIRLVDAHPRLPQLKACRGVNQWKVYDRDMKLYTSTADVTELRMKKAIVESLFPPTEDEAKTLNLHYSMRILPHHQNTGGFFVALFEKTAKCDFEGSCEIKPSSTNKHRTQKMFKDDPFTFLAKDDARWNDIREYYGVSDEFPHVNLFNRMRDGDNSRQLFFANDAVKTFVMNNQKKISIQNAGMKMFGRTESKVDATKFRISQEGVKSILPFMSKQRVPIGKEDMLTLLKSEETMVDMEKLASKDDIRAAKSGSVVLYVDAQDPVCAWIGQRTVAPYISKEERVHMLRVLGEDVEEIERMMKTKRKEKAEVDRQAAEDAKRTLAEKKENGAGDAEEAAAVEEDGPEAKKQKVDEESIAAEAENEE